MRLGNVGGGFLTHSLFALQDSIQAVFVVHEGVEGADRLKLYLVIDQRVLHAASHYRKQRLQAIVVAEVDNPGNGQVGHTDAQCLYCAENLRLSGLDVVQLA